MRKICSCNVLWCLHHRCWMGYGGPRWLHNEALNFREPTIYKSFTVYGKGTNRRFHTGHTVCDSWFIQQFEVLTAWPICSSFSCHGFSWNVIQVYHKAMSDLLYEQKYKYKQYIFHKRGEQQHFWSSNLLQDGQFGVWILVGATFSTSRPVLEFPQPLAQLVLVPFKRVKWLRHASDHQPPTSTKINKISYTFTPPPPVLWDKLQDELHIP